MNTHTCFKICSLIQYIISINSSIKYKVDNMKVYIQVISQDYYIAKIYPHISY